MREAIEAWAARIEAERLEAEARAQREHEEKEARFRREKDAKDLPDFLRLCREFGIPVEGITKPRIVFPYAVIEYGNEAALALYHTYGGRKHYFSMYAHNAQELAERLVSMRKQYEVEQEEAADNG